MKQLFRPDSWSIAARLLALALVPATFMLIAVNASLYALSLNEANVDIRERGRIIAAALSEGSRYGVVSGNVDSVERAVRGLMAADRSIAGISVTDSRGRRIVAVGEQGIGGDRAVFEAAIGAGELDVNLFDMATVPFGSASSGAAGTGLQASAVGRVHVVMSTAHILEARRQRLYLGSGLVLAAALLSAALGLVLAKKMREPLQSSLDALRDIRQGRYTVRLDRRVRGELGELQLAIVTMGQALEVTHHRLESEVASRTEELQDALAQIKATDAEKHRLIARGNELVEEERRRISLEIHDDLNAALVSIRLQVSTLSAAASEGGQPMLRKGTDRIAADLDDLYARARAIVKQLRPELLDTLGLAGALEEMVRRLDELHRGCRFEFSGEGGLPVVPEAQAIAIYRIVQEALANVVKHANATKCGVRLQSLSDHGGIKVSVMDNGNGFNLAEASGKGVGLIGMRERAMAISAELQIDPVKGSGTTIMVVLASPVGGDEAPMRKR